MYVSGTAEERFWAHVSKISHVGCWSWMGATNQLGYGIFRQTRRNATVAHRYAYIQMAGPIPTGLTLDHLCRNRGCVNPLHLEPVTLRENILRGQGFAAINARKTHCLHGHPFNAKNTAVRKDGKRAGHRVCRACDAITHRKV